MKRKAPASSAAGGKRSSASAASSAKPQSSSSASASAKPAKATPQQQSEEADAEDDYIASSGDESDDIDMTRHHVESSDGDDEDEDGDVLDVEFSFWDPREIDYKSVRRLMEKYLPGQEKVFDASGVAGAIIGQQAIGTMIKVKDDDDAYGFATVLSVDEHKDTAWMKSIKKFVLGKAPSAGVKQQVEAQFAAGGLGLLLNERIVNMPPELAPSIHESLLKDIAWAKKNALPQESRPKFAFKTLLVLSPCFSERRDDEPAPASSSSKGDDASQAALPWLGPGWDTHYIRFEEELFAQVASVSFAFAVEEAIVTSGGDSSSSAPAASSSASSSAAAAASGRGGRKHAPIAEGSSSAVLSRAALSSSSVAPKKGGKKQAKAAAAAAKALEEEVEEEEGGDAYGTALRLPQSRRVTIFPASALEQCVGAMQQLVVKATEAAAGDEEEGEE